MKAKLAALPKAKAGSLLDLIEAWRGIPGTDGRPKRDPAPEWLQLSPATRKSYERMIDPKAGYTVDGLRTMINRLCRELAEEGKVKPGLNIRSLRHSLGNELYNLGIEREARKRMMAHESDAANLVYEQGGNRSRQADRRRVP